MHLVGVLSPIKGIYTLTENRSPPPPHLLLSADNNIVTLELATEGWPTLPVIKEFRLDPEEYVCVHLGEPVMFNKTVSVSWINLY